ncbi:hypothetical protein QOZ89_09765 [Pseudofrankia sp. BMG5.37]|nr:MULTISPECIES: hypothetical protein [unclassified Pseudofrankia]MDT3439896.1 hypothetical protein [Pseudofrankia sp. BMG5.37]OHV48369.1 hypothetical protein BCD48_15380 [Pseudofrankia sp. BMG5.36]
MIVASALAFPSVIVGGRVARTAEGGVAQGLDARVRTSLDRAEDRRLTGRETARSGGRSRSEGHAAIAASATASRSSALAPSRACCDMPCSTAPV